MTGIPYFSYVPDGVPAFLLQVKVMKLVRDIREVRS